MKKNGVKIRKRALRRAAILDSLGGRCVACLEDDYCCLEIHHCLKYIHLKKVTLGAAQLYKGGLDQIEKELKICFILCSNCHKKVHKEVIVEPNFEIRDIKIRPKWRYLWE